MMTLGRSLKNPAAFYQRIDYADTLQQLKIKIAPIIPVSNVLIPAIIFSPLAPPGSAEKSTPKKSAIKSLT